jgi:hypothetical protein
MAATSYRVEAANYHTYLDELRASNTVRGRAVRSWYATGDAATAAALELRVTYEPVRATGANPFAASGWPAPLPPEITEVYAFDGAQVRALAARAEGEGKQST